MAPRPDCSTDLQERHEADIQRLYSCAIPSWVRAAVVTAIGAVVIGYFDFRSTVAANYATRDEVRETRDEWRGELREVNRKLDALLERNMSRPGKVDP